ncbi:PEP-CTERM sorting domain-containing protein [Okeania sp. SIO2B3]|uniref:PEP-CTERM sorting domain-containing protein n=1 Tax=Okeania sp. SIO2B3 TaxID=2607784 RepID=UPI0013C01DD6|nr:PEP-CTERM sorting domain-containing protein [Okeania sp. SIO2B3]NET41018.1 PEP-CTERM sorting domain-containing protein [Okeania sp. SIO2B3]
MYFQKLKTQSLVVKWKSISVGTFLSICTFAVPATATTLDFNQKIIAPDGAVDDYFGSSVAINENYALIGSYDDDNGRDSGSAYLFDTVTGNLLHKFTAPDGAFRDNFGRSVAISETNILISSFKDDDNGTDSGSVYLFDTVTGNLLHKFIAPDGAVDDYFGSSITINGTYALIGSHQDDDRGLQSGSAYLFDTVTGNLLHKFTAPDGAVSDFFGDSVAITENYALIGSYGKDDNGDNSGSAYLFDIATGNLLHKFIAFDGAAGDHFGRSVAINGTNVLISSHGDGDGSQSGSAYLFDAVTGNLIHKITAPDISAGDLFGRSVAINQSYALIGSYGDDDNGSASGSAYLFDITTGDFIQKFTAPDGATQDWFGISVAIDGNNVVTGSNGDDDNGSQSGSAYLFTINAQDAIDPESIPEPSSLLGILGTFVLGGLSLKRR